MLLISKSAKNISGLLSNINNDLHISSIGSVEKAKEKLETKVAPLIKREFRENINDLVYNWTPSVYKRRKSGGLKQGIQHKITVQKQGANSVVRLVVYNDAKPNESLARGNRYNYAVKPGYLIRWIEGYSYNYKSNNNYTNNNERSNIPNLFVPSRLISKSRTPWLYARKPLTKTAKSVRDGALRAQIEKIIKR